MPATTNKGLPILTQATDSHLPLPDPQGFMQLLAQGFDDRVPQIAVKSIPTAETFTQAAYALATTPDRVQNVVVPTDGLLAIGYAALWKVSAAATVSAAIFIGANQLKMPNQASGGAPLIQEASVAAGAATGYCHLMSNRFGLGGTMVAGADASTVTTGTTLWTPAGANDGGLCHVWVAAGTYDISVQYKNTAGSISIKERRLWVHAIPYS